jgi:hypothetical protein
MGRSVAFLLICTIAVPAQATTPGETSVVLAMPREFSLSPASNRPELQPRGAPNERPAYPTEQPRVPVNDALRPPQLLWNPTPASLVKVVPAKVRYKLKF